MGQRMSRQPEAGTGPKAGRFHSHDGQREARPSADGTDADTTRSAGRVGCCSVNWRHHLHHPPA